MISYSKLFYSTTEWMSEKVTVGLGYAAVSTTTGLRQLATISEKAFMSATDVAQRAQRWASSNK